jgi:hypothetical protein
MVRIRAKELCRSLRSEAIVRQDKSVDNELRLRILDYFITRDPSDDVFEEALKTRINDPEPAKEQSRIICAQILEAWQTRPADRL